MSSCLCKFTKGVQAPFQVKPVKDGKDNPLHALHAHKTHHWARATPHLDKTVFNDIRRP